jgi:hypothetical protein
MAGRGSGKTRAGSEWVRALVESGKGSRIALVAPTAADARDVMVEGPSGLLAVCGLWRPIYRPTRRQIVWPNGAVGLLFSAEEPERLRGPQFDHAWCDELGAWARPETWSMLMLGLRTGPNPRCCVTTTPRATDLVRGLVESPTTALTRGTTRDNAQHLAPQFLESIITRYAGTRLGRQEVEGELLEILEGAYFPQFDPARHVSEAAAYDPVLPVRLAIDAGTSRHTAAVWFQVREVDHYRHQFTVFGDYYATDLYSEANAEAIKRRTDELCFGRLDLVRLDPASTARSALGPAAYGEYQRIFGTRLVNRWPPHSVTDGLDQIELLLGPPDREPDLLIHPRCVHLVAAMSNYARACRGGQFADWPADPQHPHEDLMDSLRGGIRDAQPFGRRPQSNLRRVRIDKFF